MDDVYLCWVVRGSHTDVTDVLQGLANHWQERHAKDMVPEVGFPQLKFLTKRMRVYR